VDIFGIIITEGGRVFEASKKKVQEYEQKSSTLYLKKNI